MKKGDLNLSIQVIVVVVIAFVVLGLGLQFVRTQFIKFGGDFGDVQDQIKQIIMEELRTGNKKLSFPSQNIDLERGKSKDIGFGVKNTEPGLLNYKIAIYPVSKKDASLGEWESEVEFFYSEEQSSLSSTEIRVHSLRIFANPDSGGSYIFRLEVQDLGSTEEPPSTGNPPYDEKTFFVTVN